MQNASVSFATVISATSTWPASPSTYSPSPFRSSVSSSVSISRARTHTYRTTNSQAQTIHSHVHAPIHQPPASISPENPSAACRNQDLGYDCEQQDSCPPAREMQALPPTWCVQSILPFKCHCRCLLESVIPAAGNPGQAMRSPRSLSIAARARWVPEDFLRRYRDWAPA